MVIHSRNTTLCSEFFHFMLFNNIIWRFYYWGLLIFRKKCVVYFLKAKQLKKEREAKRELPFIVGSVISSKIKCSLGKVELLMLLWKAACYVFFSPSIPNFDLYKLFTFKSVEFKLRTGLLLGVLASIGTELCRYIIS